MSHPNNSQPPTPYDPGFSFTNWSITHPGEPHQGDKIDTELASIAASLEQTIDRLNEIQKDDGHVRPSAVNQAIDELTTQAAEDAAAKTYADNLASVADKLEAQANLLLPSHYPKADGSTLWIHSDALNAPSFPEGTPLSNQSSSGDFPGLLGTSTAFSRQFRASVIFGTEYDYPTNVVGGSTNPASSRRVDNVSMALLYGGTLGKPIDGGNPDWPADTFQGDYTKLNLLPSVENPFATVRQIVDAVDSRQAAHESGYDHLNIPSADQKAAMDEAAAPSATNPFATVDDLAASGSLTADQVAAVAGSSTPSASNVVITTSALTTALAAKADAVHGHDWSEVTDGLGTPIQNIIDAKAEATDLALKADATHTHAISDVTNLQSELDGKASSTDAGLAKAWVSFDGTTTPPTIKSSHNVTSVTRSTTGVYVVNFTTAFADADYCWTGSARGTGASYYIVYQSTAGNSQTTSALTLVTSNSAGPVNCSLVNVVVHA